MRIYLSYSQFKAIRKSVIISDFILIIFTAIAFYASFFVEIYHFFIFAGACFLVKWLSNSFVEEQFHFPAGIHLIAPLSIITCLLVISFVILIFISTLDKIVIFFFLLVGMSFIALLYSIYKYLPSYFLYQYYKLMGVLVSKNMNMVCLILQIACFYSIAFSVFLSIDFGEHPIQEFVFLGLFAPLGCFAIFNLIEIIVFALTKFPKSGRFFEYEIKENSVFIIPLILAIFLAFLIASSPYFIQPFVKNYLGSQYKPTMEKWIKQKYGN